MAESVDRIEKSKKEPTIRTMKTDISEFLKTTKPSLISLLARQAEMPESRPRRIGPQVSMRAVVILLIASIIIIGAGISYLVSTRKLPSFPAASQTPAEPPIIFFESASEIIIEKKQPGLLAALVKAGREKQTPGTFRRIIIKIKSAATAEEAREMTLEEFFELSGRSPAPGFSQNISTPPQFFIYQQGSVPQFGLLIASGQPARTFQELLSAESALPRDLEIMFLGSLPPPGVSAFSDFTYKNTDFRFIKLNPASDRGLGYLIFQAKRLIVITTSEEAVRRIIDRLFQNQ